MLYDQVKFNRAQVQHSFHHFKSYPALTATEKTLNIKIFTMASQTNTAQLPFLMGIKKKKWGST